MTIELISEAELEHAASRLHKKVSKYFQESLKNELSKLKPKKADHNQVIRIVNYALAMTNADLINIFAKMANDGGIALRMLEVINKLSEKAVMDFYEANKPQDNETHLFHGDAGATQEAPIHAGKIYKGSIGGLE